MTLYRFALAASALSLAASPAIAQTERTSEPATDASAMEGGSSIVLLILAVAAIIAGVVIAASGGDDSAVSP